MILNVLKLGVVMCLCLLFKEVGKATDLIAVGNTTTMRVTWVKPSGNVEMYNITIYQDQILSQYAIKTNEEVVFQNLLPGTTYTVTVTTKSGQFEEQSDMVKNATCKFHKAEYAGLLSMDYCLAVE